jgi:hypothetical protein
MNFHTHRAKGPSLVLRYDSPFQSIQTSTPPDLIARRSRAHQESWLGEIEGLDLTLSHLRGKRDQTRRMAHASGLVDPDLADD